MLYKSVLKFSYHVTSHVIPFWPSKKRMVYVIRHRIRFYGYMVEIRIMHIETVHYKLNI